MTCAICRYYDICVMRNTIDAPAEVLCNPDLIDQAALKETSLFTLAEKCGITPPENFVDRFILHDREVRSHGSSDGT